MGDGHPTLENEGHRRVHKVMHNSRKQFSLVPPLPTAWTRTPQMLSGFPVLRSVAFYRLLAASARKGLKTVACRWLVFVKPALRRSKSRSLLASTETLGEHHSTFLMRGTFEPVWGSSVVQANRKSRAFNLN